MILDGMTTTALEKDLHNNLKINRSYCEEIIKELKRRSNHPQQVLGLDEQLKTIMSNFDWGEVHHIFTKMGYTWFYSTSPGSIPTIEELKTSARNLLTDVWNTDERNDCRERTISTGRFTYSRRIYDGIKILSLEFIPVDYLLDYDWVTRPHDGVEEILD